MHAHVFLHLHVFECDAWQHMQEIKVQYLNLDVVTKAVITGRQPQIY